MGINLSADEKRRIEHEEHVRVAEAQYRAEVRKGIVSGDRGRPRQSRGRTILILVVLMFIVFLWIKSHQ